MIGDPTRAAMLGALLGGEALPAGELARRAGIAPATATSLRRSKPSAASRRRDAMPRPTSRRLTAASGSRARATTISSAPGSRESRARAQFDWRSADAKGCFVRWVWSAAN